MTPELVSGFGASILSLFLTFFGKYVGYEKLSPRGKQLVWLVCLVLGVGLIMLLACGGFMETLNWQVQCTLDQFVFGIRLALGALAGGAGTYVSTKRLTD